MGDPGSIPGSGRSPAEGNGNPLSYSCLENPMDCSLPGSSVHGVAKSQTLYHYNTHMPCSMAPKINKTNLKRFYRLHAQYHISTIIVLYKVVSPLLNILCAYSTLLPTECLLISTNLFSVSIVLPFLKCPPRTSLVVH